MKKLIIVSAIFILSSCGDSTDNNATNDNATTNANGTDTGSLTNPITIDTLKHPSGVDNSSVISTDTAAMNVQNTYDKADSIARKKSK